MGIISIQDCPPSFDGFTTVAFTLLNLPEWMSLIPKWSSCISYYTDITNTETKSRA
jgi:hypothetical protein